MPMPRRAATAPRGLPFNTFIATTLSGADGAGDLDDADDYIFLHGASAAITQASSLEANQHLIGEHAGCDQSGNSTAMRAPTPWCRPTRRSAPVINGGAGNAVTVIGPPWPTRSPGWRSARPSTPSI